MSNVSKIGNLVELDRKIRNKEISDQLRSGSYIKAQTNLQQSWFPGNRNPIKKNPDAFEILVKKSKSKFEVIE